MKVHLVDGTFELFRCFFGAPRAVAADGREVGAARALLSTLVALLRAPDVSHVAVAFDAMASAGRGEPGARDSDRLRAQAGLARDVVRALGIALWPMVRFEADDALATGALLYRDAPGVDQVVICTTDNDLVQCVRGERVVLLDRIHDRVTDEPAVRDRFGIPPETYPDLLALVGAPAKGVPGVPRWGPRSAAAVLRRYRRLEEIPADAAAWDVDVRGARGLAESLERRRREATLVRDLVTLRTHVPLSDGVADLAWRGARRDELTALVEAIGADGALLTRIPYFSTQ